MAFHRGHHVALSAVAALAVGYGAWRLARTPVYGPRGAPGRTSEAIGHAAFARERAVAEELGLRTAGTQDVALAPDAQGWASWSAPFALAERQCAAVVASTWGYQRPYELSIVNVDPSAQIPRDEDALVTLREMFGPVAHVQWCAPAGTRLWIYLRARTVDDERRAQYASGSFRIALFTGAWSATANPSRLNRGRFTPVGERLLATQSEGAGAAVANELARAYVPAGLTPVGDAIPLTLTGARLLPATRETYHALYRASASDAGVAVNPRLDPAGFDGGAPAMASFAIGEADNAMTSLGHTGARPTPHDPVFDRARNDFLRVLTVVDLAQLGAECATLVFTRQLPSYRAEVQRIDVTRWTATPLTIAEHVATDTHCPARGVYAYAVPDTDQAAYTLQVYRPATSADAGVAPSAPAPSRRRQGGRQ